MHDGLSARATRRRRLLTAGLLLAGALGAPAAASAASYDHAFRVGGLKGTVVADVTVTQRATEETPEIEVYGGTGTVTLGLQARPGAQPATGRLRWNPGRGGTITVPAALRFAWNESAGRGDAYGHRRRCVGRTRQAQPRRLVHVLAVERQGARVRVRWSIPQARLGRAGCVGAGTLPAVTGVDLYPASTFDHREVRIGVQGSDRVVQSLRRSRVRTTTVRWDFTITLVQA